MRTYVVRAGDTPASIAAADEHAGCPKCSIDLIKANPHKERVVYPNGFLSFKEMRAGEVLNLPDKWFDGSLDLRPPAYFAALPSADGRTPATLGDASTVGPDYTAIDTASANMGARLLDMSDLQFEQIVHETVRLIGTAVDAASKSGNATAMGYAQDAKAGAYWADRRAVELDAAVVRGDKAAADAMRPEIINVLNTAIGSARLALQAAHSPTAEQPAGVRFPPDVVAAAQAVAAAAASDRSYCASVARSGTPVNATIHAFKVAWNASQPGKVPVNTGNYEQATADALKQVIGMAPAACPARTSEPTAPPPPPPSSSDEIAAQPGPNGVNMGSVLGVALLGAAVVGGILYLTTNATEDAPPRRQPPAPAGPKRRSAHRPVRYDFDEEHYT